MSSKSKGKAVEQLRLCSDPGSIMNPDTPDSWKGYASHFLGLPQPSNILLSGLREWRVGTEQSNSLPSGSKLGFENFLHLRCLVQNEPPAEFNIEDFVDQAYINAATKVLDRSMAFQQYLQCVQNGNPDIDVSDLGPFGSAKILQNHVLIEAYRPVPPTGRTRKLAGVPAQLLRADDGYQTDQELETPYVRRFVTPEQLSTGGNWSSLGKSNADAFDEMIVNEAALEYLSALTRSYMKKLVYGNSPTRGQKILEHERTLARWTIARNRFVIQEHRRPNDNEQTALLSEKARRKDALNSLKYVPVLETQTDGYLYSADEQEVLAIVEVKKRLRDINPTKIEWQEAAEILGWLNIRLRTEREESKTNPKSKDHRADRKGLLNPTQDGKYRWASIFSLSTSIQILILNSNDE